MVASSVIITSTQTAKLRHAGAFIDALLDRTRRLSSRTPSGARQALTRIGEILQGLGLRLSERKTKLVTAYQGWISWGTG